VRHYAALSSGDMMLLYEDMTPCSKTWRPSGDMTPSIQDDEIVTRPEFASSHLWVSNRPRLT
jgi:hypothetical protein